jgi:putative acetyltransferase
VSGPDASDPLRHADGGQPDARRNEDEGRQPDSLTDTDREHTANEPTPGDIHSPRVVRAPARPQRASRNIPRLGQPDVATREAACQHLGVLIRRYESTDADRVREIHAQAFRRIDAPDAVPPEVALFDALVEADDVIPQLSLVAVGDADLVGHVMCSRATVEARAVAALGPISVDPRNQRQGVGLAMMHAVLSAADALDVPLVGLLGSLQYYSRFGFTLAETLGIESPYPELSHHFQVRILAGYDSSISGRFRYAPAFDLV